MQPENDKIPTLYGCNNCHQEGWIFLDSPHTTVFVVCPHCRNELAYAYCPECDIFTNFLARSEVRRPSSWRCLECNKEYVLNPDFYENPVKLHFESEIPVDVRSRLKKQTARQLAFLLASLLLVIALIARKLLFFLRILEDPVTNPQNKRATPRYSHGYEGGE